MLASISQIATALAQDAPRPGFFDGLQGLGFLLALLGIAVTTWFTIRDLRRRVRQLRGERDKLRQELTERDTRYREFYEAVDTVTREKAISRLTGAKPLANPPSGVQPVLERLSLLGADVQADPLYVGLGWYERQGRARLLSATFAGSSEYAAGNIAISGVSGWGKGNLAFLLLATACLRATPRQVQVFALDPKRDFALWKGKAHNWREPVLGRDPALIAAAMQELRAERERRELLRERHQVLNHEELPEQIRPPVLLVYIGEISVLELGTSDLDSWLDAEMGTARAAGIRYVVDDQNNSGRSTRYRAHYGTLAAGFQVSQDSVKPNLGMGPEEIRKLGGIPPNELKERGTFTVRSEGTVYTVRVPLISLEERREALARLPNALAPRMITPISSATPGTATTPSAQPAKAKVVVTEEERARIVAAAPQFTSRGELAAAVFDGRRTGEPYQKVKLVCDEQGLLLPNLSRERESSDSQTVEAA